MTAADTSMIAEHNHHEPIAEPPENTALDASLAVIRERRS